MSTYYDYREVKVMIAHKLMQLQGWKVYGYHADESDFMTDYYSPAYWGGIAEKNGYILCVNVYGAAEPQEIRKYNHTAFTYDHSVAEKIKKLEQMTVARGASEAEEASAKSRIKRLQEKAQTLSENQNKYDVIGIIPGHMAHPPKMNWHIEKDGMIIEKGNGILKYASVSDYYSNSYKKDQYELFKKNRNDYIEKTVRDLIWRGYCDNEEDAHKQALKNVESMENDEKLIKQFEVFINKIDTACGGLLGQGDGTMYEKVIVTEYKSELKVLETPSGSVKEGQLFILKAEFNYGCRKGLVYRIHETLINGKTYYHAYKLNGKLTKECTGRANSNNHWCYFGEKFNEWIKNGSIAWCELQEVKTPYKVEKVVKKSIKAPTKNKTEENVPLSSKAIEYSIEKSKHTQTNDDIWLVKIKNKLSKEEFKKVQSSFSFIKGYYSRFTHSFIFKYDPTEKLAQIY